MPGIKYAYMQNFMFVGVLVIEIREFNKKKMKKNMAKLWKSKLQVLQDFLIFSRYH